MRKKGDGVDGWTLHRLLGIGGNAEVWEASRDNRKVALKILKNKNKESEQYKRFSQEILSLNKLVDEPGVLPLLDHSLPEELSSKHPGWLAMPVATQLDKSLAPDPSLTKVVSAVYQISETLARCAEKGIFHRDIKPANLYWIEGRSVIGDFGLVYLPNREALTESGKKLGPLFFLPDEMLNDAATAQPGPADVFMLAKTLWVLATGQNYPPQGEIRTENRQTRLSGYWNEPKAHLLDELVERCTNMNPHDRPKIMDVAEELSAWLAYDTAKTPSTTNLLDIGAKLKPLISAHRDNLTLNTKRKRECERLQEEITVLLQPLANQIIQQTNLHVEVNKVNHINSIVRHPAKYNKGVTSGLSANIVAKVESGRMSCGFLVSGIGLMVKDDVPTISLFSAHAIRRNIEHLLWSKQVEIIPGSAYEKQAIAELVDELCNSLRNALNDYADHLTNTEPVPNKPE